ncbi:histidine phosphatase superfamily [Aspergillus avenaceus]|uniref:Histidine phosphatase superfamily n=1 Tax=Aspergillus avenaceus TaxID=36643 RepID=A0A5N6TDL6_ASPAV|nr:histidine phosphatase superfamily [Aspergillus avenaceus]
MGKPRMIILIRHAQSEGNKNREIHQTIPDHRVKLTPEGHRQAQEAGARLRDLLRPDDTIHFFTSPYRRTRETTEGILQSLTSDSPSPSPFPRHTIKVYEEPRLREQDFGNFQPCSAEMERMWLERADYGHFFYRIPNGESAADAYDRVSGFNESLWREFGENDFASVCVLVTHGLMTRVFLMKWYHWSVEYFEDLRNINHCEFVIMKLNQDNGKYMLQNHLRTWSELRKEKELERQQERAAKGLAPSTSIPSEAPPIRRKWGGCPEGCNHGIRRKGSLRSSRTNGGDHTRVTHDTPHKKSQEIGHICGHTTQESNVEEGPSPTAMKLTTQVERQILTAPEPALGDAAKEAKPMSMTMPTPTPQYSFLNLHSTNTQLDLTETRANKDTSNPNAVSTKASPIPKRPDLSRFHRDSEDHLLHPPRSNYALIHLSGRDGGGTLSGANSVAPSEDEHEDYSTRSTNRPIFHQPKPSQDLDNDGDDEGSGTQTQRLRRSRSNHHRHNHLPAPGRRNLAKKAISNGFTDRGRDESNPEDFDEHEHEHEHNGDGDDDEPNDGYTTLEAERREDQSIRGSVY